MTIRALAASLLLAGLVAGCGPRGGLDAREPADDALRGAVETLASDQRRERTRAAERLRASPERARPLLRERLRESGDPTARALAARILADLRPVPREDLELLAGLLHRDHPKVEAAVLEAVDGLGPEIVPYLLPALERGSAQRRSEIGARIARAGAEVVAELLDRGRAGDPATQRAVAATLLQMDELAGVAEQVLPFLLELLEGPEARTREIAAEALARTGARAVPPLVVRLRGDDPEQRRLAVSALASIPEAKDALLGLARSGDPGDRRLASVGLGAFRPLDEAIVRSLAHAVCDRDASVREAALMALRRHAGRRARGAVPELYRTLEDDDPRLRELAEEVLVEIGPSASRRLSRLVASEEDLSLARRAISVLGRQPAGASRAIPFLERTVESGPPELRAAARSALSRIHAHQEREGRRKGAPSGKSRSKSK